MLITELTFMFILLLKKTYFFGRGDIEFIELDLSIYN